ncbi:MAG: HDIG domain-containing protein [candidate division WOR-3 bacterium]|nr:HDIG domain-containing protein [candidate division WOR-3 bacterium]
MQRAEAYQLVVSMVTNKNLIKHMLATEVCMKYLARHLCENEEEWGLVGLLHDLDYDATVNNPEQHSLITAKILQDKGLSEEQIEAIKAHCGKAGLHSKMAKALYAVDPVTGLIVASALMHPEKKLAKLDKEFILRRYKEKSFARGANREQIASCSELGLSLDNFIDVCLKAMTEIASELGL